MSLINDALKRAKEAQQKNLPASAPDLPLRPVEVTEQPGRRSGLALLATIGVAFVVLAVLLWHGFQRRVTPLRNEPASAQPVLPATATSVVVPPPAPLVPAIQTGLASQQASLPAMSKPTTEAPGVGATPTPVSEAASTEPAPVVPAPNSSSVPATVVVPLPQPVPFKLQGILYRQRNPVAVINGKTVGVGDRVGEATVAAIHPDSTDVVVAGETIKLNLVK